MNLIDFELPIFLKSYRVVFFSHFGSMYVGFERLRLNLANANVKKLIEKVRNQLDDTKPVYKVYKRSFPTKYMQ